VSTNTPSSDVAFRASVKAVQERRGARKAYRRMEKRGDWQTRVNPELADFLAERDSAYLASSAGQPYRSSIAADQTASFADWMTRRLARRLYRQSYWWLDF